jgi:CRISPR/Cas system-associated exonuclease Cas4 (RecB family)
VPLPPAFTFSQASLQDYADCPRRFQLRYVLGVRWPAAREDSQWEQKAQIGAAFHRMVQRYTVGVAKGAIEARLGTDELRQWWKHYLQTPPEMPVALRLPEVRLTTPLAAPGAAGQMSAGLQSAGHLSARYRLMARYDLLAVDPGERAVIVDWKTNEKRPPRARLQDRWQTLVYRYVLVQAGTQLNGNRQWKPDQIELVYWFANYPAQPERFAYDDAQYAEDEWTLRATIGEIASGVQEEWALTDDLRQCRYCTYRTLCDREKVDADTPEWEPEDAGISDLEFDLEQVAEIEF